MRQVKVIDSNHAVRFRGGPADRMRELVLIKGGKRAYVWASTDEGVTLHFSGPKSLRALAKAILKEVGDE